MLLKHINLTVEDIAESRDFLIKYFGLTMKTEQGRNPEVLTDGEGFILTLMKGRKVSYPQTFHIGFPQQSKEQVDKINLQLIEGGFEAPTPKQTPHGYTFYVMAPGGFKVEVMAF